MKTYIAMLRGINVSGQKKIKMADLRAHLSTLDFTAVQTYIQSGNVVFKSANATLAELEAAIRQKILDEYGFEVGVMARTPADFEAVLRNNPFADRDLNRLYVTFLGRAPAPERLRKLEGPPWLWPRQDEQQFF